MRERIVIKIQGSLDESWKDWFDGMEVTSEGDVTILTGKRKDKAHLHGILNRIRDLNLTLISLNPEKGKTENED